VIISWVKAKQAQMDLSGEFMADSNDDIIELTQVVEEDALQEDHNILELTQLAEDQDDMLELENAAGAALPEKLQESAAAAVSPDQTGPDLSGFTKEQLDAAIERVVEKKFSRQIEQILFEVTEKVIKREIAEIKAGLQRDLDHIDNA